MLPASGRTMRTVKKGWPPWPGSLTFVAITAAAMAVMMLTGPCSGVGAVSLAGVRFTGHGGPQISRRGQNRLSVAGADTGADRLSVAGADTGADRLSVAGADTGADRPEWLHDGIGGPGPGPEPLPPIDSCPPRCRCYYRAYRGCGVPDKLLTVNCTGLGLMEFPERLPAHTQVLDMSANNVQNLTTLPRLTELLVLDMSSNWLRVVDNRWLFEHVAQLTVLNLAHNALRQLQDGTFLGLRDLLVLDVSGNRLQRTELHAFADLRSLEVFRMDGNDLFHVRREWFLSMPSLVELRLSDNGLTSLVAGELPLPRLQHLDLSQNRFRKLDHRVFAGLENLRLVNVSDNRQLLQIPNEALKLVPALDILLLDGLGVVRLVQHAVSGLSAVEMSLSYMPELRSIGRAAFHNLTRLKTLQLHDCPRLAFLHPEAFSGVPRLRRLLIHNNALVAVSQRIVKSLPHLADLHLYHNPFRCDCNVYWLRKELSEYSRRHYSHVNKENTPSSSAAPLPSAHGAADSSRLDPVLFPPPSSISTSSKSISTASNGAGPQGSNINKFNNIYSTIISDPGRVSCFFPDGASSLPLVQQPLQYFPETCPPVALAFFPPRVNVSLGEPLDLECEGLGVPEPSVSWVLPHGEEINASAAHAVRIRETMASTKAGAAPSAYLHIPGDVPSSSSSSSSPHTNGHSLRGNDEIKSHAEIRDDTTLHIPELRLTDTGSYGCHVTSPLGQDFSTVVVHVQRKPLTFTPVTVSNVYLTVAWEGSIPRAQMREFQLFYRKAPATVNSNGKAEDGIQGRISKLSSGDNESSSGHESKVSSEAAKLDLKEHGDDFRVVNLRGSTHVCTISGLEPQTRYELCLVYRSVHPIQCQLLTTTAQDVARVVRTGAGIAVHVSKTQIGTGIGLVLGALVVIWAGLVLRRARRRGRKNYQDYADPLREEKASIPLEGLRSSATTCGSAAPSTPLTSSRTALLTHSQI